MKLHRFARGLLAAVLSVMALAGGTGVARADDTVPAPTPPLIDQLLTETPVLFVDPAHEGGPSLSRTTTPGRLGLQRLDGTGSVTNSGGVGMACENLFARCR
jgi:hypothetical protein